MSRLDILHLTTFLQGGAGRAITDLACAQHAAGHGVTVVTSHSPVGEFGNYPHYLERLRAAGVEVVLCDSLFVRDRAAHEHVVERLVEQGVVSGRDARRGFVVHAHAAVPASIGRELLARTGRRAPVVQTQHGWGISKTAEQAAYDVDVLKRVDRIITTSRATAQLVGDYGAPRGAITVIPCGLPAAEAGEVPSEAEFLNRMRAGGARIIGCIGSVTANKNQRLLLDALEWIEDPSLMVLFIGEGSEDLMDEARERGIEDQVISYGYQPDAARWLPLFDLLVVPSRTEGQGLVALEAFRAGVPVVASHIPAFTELIDDGRNGFVFAPMTAGALAGAIRRALALPAAVKDQLLAAARQQFERDFTLDAMVRRHEELYREVIEARRAVGIAQ